jgi:hypothetical protein
MKMIGRFFAAAVLTLTGVRVAYAGTDVWTSNGPPSALRVSTQAIDPSTPSTL